MKKGIFFALTTAAISGVSIFYNKLIVVQGIDPLVFNILKNGGVALFLSSLLIVSKESKTLQHLSRRQWIQLLLIGLIGGSIPFVLFFQGLTMIPAVQATLIHKTLFLWVALMAVPLLKERVSTLQLLGYAGVIGSLFFVGGIPKFSGTTGEWMILAATLLWSVENILAKLTLRSIPAEVVAWGRMFFGTCILFLLATLQGKTGMLMTLSPSLIIPILGSVVLLTGYVTFWYKALAKTPATVVSSLLILATPITALLSQPGRLISSQTLIQSILLLSIMLIAFFPHKNFHRGKTITS